ncbi:DNA helicase-2/ATP-dependent DNA helicase PcrA [Arthrobacter ulcerisalmonis]|nr:ATP-dependent helicase [Arthrobacter ulcerisalmonis]MDQ0663382.1 DNA helicase-2/ATP-dependent DNA helicase PcrA [Arthrobacter ulcerisalmonis]
MTALARSIKELQANERQWNAFNSEGHCVVVAPPGSGKTKLLTTRMAHDLATKVKAPQGAACLTFSVAAAQELKSRLLMLGGDNRPASFVGTVHSFAWTRVLLPFAAAAGRPDLRDLRIATRAEEAAAFKASVSTNFVDFGDTTNLRSTVDVARKRFYSPAEWAALGPGVVETAEGYRTNLSEAGLIDFDGVIEEAVGLVRDSESLRRVIQSRYPLLFVDEYQDLAPGLDELVKLLCFGKGHGSTLFAVGDPDQAVYAFNGANPELLMRLAERPTVSTVELAVNYRSGIQLIQAAARMKKSAHVVQGVRSGGAIEITFCPRGFEEQVEKLTEGIRRAIDHGTPAHEIAVICATNELCIRLGNALNNSSIPTVYRTTDYRQTEATLFMERCAAWCFLGREASGTRLSVLLSAWRRLHGSGRAATCDVALTNVILSVDPLVSHTATEFIDLIMAAGLSDALRNERNSEELTEMEKMLRAVGGSEAAEKDVMFLAQRGLTAGRVHVMTMTSSKGLEFSRVYMPGLDEGGVPGYYARKSDDEMVEERRKFYVSLTRAKDYVELLFSGYFEGRYGVDSYGPSRFLFELNLLT